MQLESAGPRVCLRLSTEPELLYHDLLLPSEDMSCDHSLPFFCWQHHILEASETLDGLTEYSTYG